MVVVNANRTAVLISDDGAVKLIPLPSLRDGRLHHFIEVLHQLPEHFCLSVNRETGYVRVLRVPDKAATDFIKGGKGEATVPGIGDDLLGEAFHADGECSHSSRAGGKVSDSILIVRQSSLPGLI